MKKQFKYVGVSLLVLLSQSLLAQTTKKANNSDGVVLYMTGKQVDSVSVKGKIYYTQSNKTEVQQLKGEIEMTKARLNNIELAMFGIMDILDKINSATNKK